ncbi:MAG: hypothetical protein P4L69_15980 [Desulfosporosinus sp.]|nr:hypothetical protein [Desulfosporosinus sp.]
MKFKMMAGTLSIMVMLSTPTLAQAQVTSDISPVPLIGQSEIFGLKANVLQQGEELDLLQAQITALNIDTTGLTEDEINLKLKTVGRAKQLATLLERAKALDVDITGLTNVQARTKIKAAERANTLTDLLAHAKTLGIGVETRLC